MITNDLHLCMVLYQERRAARYQGRSHRDSPKDKPRLSEKAMAEASDSGNESADSVSRLQRWRKQEE